MSSKRLARLAIIACLVTGAQVPSSPEAFAKTSRGGFFGSIFRGGSDDDEIQTPPTPPLGRVTPPLQVAAVLPGPIAPPSIPKMKEPEAVAEQEAVVEQEPQVKPEVAEPDEVVTTAEAASSDVVSIDAEKADMPTTKVSRLEIDTIESAWSEHELKLQDAVGTTLSRWQKPLDMHSSSPARVLQSCWAWGNRAELQSTSRDRKRVNAIGALCWNVPLAGKTLLRVSGSDVIPRTGHGYQTQRGELLAMLAMASVSDQNEIRVSDSQGTIQNLVAWEQRSLQPGGDLSMVLIGLSQYLDWKAHWTDLSGEPWSLQRIAELELNREVPVTDSRAVDRLMGLTYYVLRARRHGAPRTGLHRQIEQYLARFQIHSLGLQGSNGSWSPLYFGYRSETPIVTEQLSVPNATAATERLYSTGNVLLWLTMSLTPNQLRSAKIQNAVAFVSHGLATTRIGSTPRDFQMAMRSVAALSIYQRRVFEGIQTAEPETDKTQIAEESSPTLR